MPIFQTVSNNVEQKQFGNSWRARNRTRRRKFIAWHLFDFLSLLNKYSYVCALPRRNKKQIMGGGNSFLNNEKVFFPFSSNWIPFRFSHGCDSRLWERWWLRKIKFLLVMQWHSYRRAVGEHKQTQFFRK